MLKVRLQTSRPGDGGLVSVSSFIRDFDAPIIQLTCHTTNQMSANIFRTQGIMGFYAGYKNVLISSLLFGT